METVLVLALILLVYSVAVFLFMRFFAFVRSCDSEMRTMVDRKTPGRFRLVTPKKKRARKTRAPRFVPA